MPIKKLSANQTLLWPTRAGDLAVWFRWPGVLAMKAEDTRPIDFWELHDGDQIMLTTRSQDLPEPLRSAPTRSVDPDTEAEAVLRSLRGSQELPEGPHIWRPVAGDRIIWAGTRRDGPPVIIDAVECDTCALVLGQPRNGDWMNPPFGTPHDEKPSDASRRIFVVAHRAFAEAGPSRTISVGGWRLGE